MSARVFRPFENWLASLPTGVPCTLSDTRATTGLNGGMLQLNADKLSAPFNKSMLVEGIRFRCSMNGTGLQGGDQALGFGVRVSCGPFVLTDDVVNVSGLAERVQYNNGELGAFANVATQGGYTLPVRRTDFPGAQYTWRFARPFFVPDGLPIRVTIRRHGNVSTDWRDDDLYAGTTEAGNGTAAVFGRYFLENVKVPRGLIIPVPYATVFADVTIPALSVASPMQIVNLEYHLRNITETQLHADRLIGRLPTRTVSGGAGGGGGSGASFGEYIGPETTISLARTYATRPDHQRGSFGLTSNRHIVAPPKPYNAVFDFRSRAFSLKGMEIPPGDGLIATVFKATVAGNSTTRLRTFPIIGLLGVREEKW